MDLYICNHVSNLSTKRKPFEEIKVFKKANVQNEPDIKKVLNTDVSKKNYIPLPSLNWVDNRELWANMLIKESNQKIPKDFLQKNQIIDPYMRAILLDWLQEVCEDFCLHRETYYVAQYMIDKYLSKKINTPKNRLQLLGISSLFVASKIEEIYPPKINEFADSTDSTCSEAEIISQEMILLETLKWKLSPTTSVSWLAMYFQIMNFSNSEAIFELPNFSAYYFSQVAKLLDLCTLDSNFAFFTYSELASASLSFYFPKEIVSKVTGFTSDKLSKCVDWMQPFAEELKKNFDLPNNKISNRVRTEDQHNIQRHNTDNLNMLKRVFKKSCKTENSEEATQSENIIFLSPNKEEIPDLLITPPCSTEKILPYSQNPIPKD